MMMTTMRLPMSQYKRIAFRNICVTDGSQLIYVLVIFKDKYYVHCLV